MEALVGGTLVRGRAARVCTTLSAILLLSSLPPSLRAEDQGKPAYEPASGISGTLTSIGSDTLGTMMKRWQEAFARRYPAVSLEYEGKGSGTAPIALTRGVADMGLMSRAMLPSEEESFAARFGYPPTRIIVARDRLTVFVRKDNPIERISFSELDALYSATRFCGARRAVTSWGELGLSDEWARRGISLYGRNAASGTYASFKRLALCRGDFSTRVNVFGGGAALVEAVANDPAGIGYGPAGLLDGRVKSLEIEREGTRFARRRPSSPAEDSDPLERELFVYVNRAPVEPLDELVREFLLFVLSREGQEIVSRAGYLPLDESERAHQRALVREAAAMEADRP